MFIQWLERNRLNTVVSTNQLLSMIKDPNFNISNLPENYKEIQNTKNKIPIIYRRVEIFQNPSKYICHVPILVLIQKWLL